MGKIKQKFISLKWSFLVYLSICFVVAFLGAMAIGFGTNHMQEWYMDRHKDVRLIYTDTEIALKNNEPYLLKDGRPIAEKKYRTLYFIISDAQFVITPLWIILSVAVTGVLFYKRELKEPITILLDASQKISENQLDFKIEYKRKNELGQLCNAYEEMRRALDENNRDMWRSLEERKRLNSAFSHDLRTPLTVLKGHNDFLLKYAGKLSEEKIQNDLEMMRVQIDRLENYTCKMSAAQKLEDIVPDILEVHIKTLRESLETSGEYLCGDKSFHFSFCSDADSVFADMELVSEVYENMLSNAVRYAKSKVFADVSAKNNAMSISVTDDGAGFSERSLKLATDPFYRGDLEQNSTHFGLGLYICRILCEKCGGSLTISNTETGGTVTAKFICKSR